MDASPAKVPNHGSCKQIVCSSTPGGSSGRLKALCTLGLLIPAFHSPQQHWRPTKGNSWPWRRGMAQWSTGATTYQEGLERTEKAGGRELVTKVWKQNRISSTWSTSPKLPWRTSPEIRSSEMGWREFISLPLIIPLNEEMVELVGHHKLFHGLDHPPGIILGAVSPQFQSCTSGGNWKSCVLLSQGQWPCKANHRTPWPCQDGWSRAVMWTEVGQSENTLEL